MELDYVLVDVFAESRLAGNQLAVFPEAPGLADGLMQAIAREMNLSETTFVTSTEPTGYRSRIFTPGLELPFAGHPTLGTAWVLRHLGQLDDGPVVQETKAGQTSIEFDGDMVWLQRNGDSGVDCDDMPSLAKELGVPTESIGLRWPRDGREAADLVPAVASAGIPQLMVPLRSPEAVDALRAGDIREPDGTFGAYFFSFTGPAEISARFFASEVGVAEDPATGSAAAALGLYLGRRLGTGRVVISQGRQIGRPSRLYVEFAPGNVKVGGNVIRVGRGVLSFESFGDDQAVRATREASYPASEEIEVSARCLACGEEPGDRHRCHPDPERVAKLQWFRDQPSFELRENIGSGHIVAVRRDKPIVEQPAEE